MSTTRAERLRGGIAALVAGLIAPLAASCTTEQPDAPPTGRATVPLAVPEDVANVLQALLDDRTEAFLDGRPRALMAMLDPRARPLRRDERILLSNYRQLPVAELGFTLDRGSIVSDGDEVTAVVRRTLRLAEYDALPVETPDRLRFQRRDGAWLLADDHDPAWQEANGIDVPPWDRGPIEVRSVAGVLGIFDASSIGRANGVLTDVRDGLDDVAAAVPLDWDQRVVVYALSDNRALASIGDLPRGDPDRLDGLAFPVPAGPQSTELAATRFVLHPRMLEADGIARERLIRHELTHVAIGVRDDHVPLWLSEGIAEWVSVQPIRRSRRMLPQEALDAAYAPVVRLPTDEDFDGPRPGAAYGVSWWACEWIVRQRESAALWALLEAMAAGDGTPESDQDVVLTVVLGVDGATLAGHSARLIRRTFGPG